MSNNDRLVSRDQNNFNLLRLLAALGVIITHSYALLGLPERDILHTATHGLLSFSRLGVYVFFVISGFLIANSLEHSPTAGSFFWKRFLRIFPALAVVLALTVFVLGPIMTVEPLRQYFSHLGTYRYLVGGLTLYGLIYTLPGVFVNNIYPRAVNGSLWTLPYEWTCYVALACLASLFKKRRAVTVALFIVAILGIRVLVGHFRAGLVIPVLNLDTRQLIEWGILFFFGVLALDARKYIQFTFVPAFIFAVELFLLRGKLGYYWMLVAIPYITFYLASLPLPEKIFRLFTKFDYSYGVYIYAFPVGQLVAGAFGRSLNVASLAALTMLGTLPLAMASWYLIEKPMLKLKAKTLSKPWLKLEYLYDAKYRNYFLIKTLAELKACPIELQPLVFLAGKSPELIPVRDNGEKMIPLASALKDAGSRIILTAGEAEYGAQTLSTHAMRQNALERLLKAEKLLAGINKDLTFKITDSFRPISLQKQYFDKVTANLSAQGLSGEELYIRTTQVIADPKSFPPHACGGTLDITIYTIKTKQNLNMGSVLDDVADPKARTFHPDIPKEAQENRLLLYWVLTEVGFVNTPSEWWHYSYGDREWAIKTNQPSAIYDSCDILPQ